MIVNGVEFDEEEVLLPRTRLPRPKSKKDIGAWLIAHKIAKDPLQANVVLLVIIVVCMLATGVALYVKRLHPVPPSYDFQVRASLMNRKVPYGN